jgi:hypothetical protein
VPTSTTWITYGKRLDAKSLLNFQVHNPMINVLAARILAYRNFRISRQGIGRERPNAAGRFVPPQ